MKAIGIIMRKELFRVFSDKKMVFGLFILPVIMVVGVIFLVGILAVSMMKDWEDHEPTVALYQAPESFLSYIEESQESLGVYDFGGTVFHISELADESELATAKEEIYDGTLDLIIEFPTEFDSMIAQYKEGAAIPEVKTYYNPSEDYSSNARSDALSTFMTTYKKQLLEERIGDLNSLTIFDIDSTNTESVIQNDNKAQGKNLGSVVPYLVTILLFSSAMSLGSDSFAGEKERGTMSALLMTPVKRSYIVYGKLFALMILAAMSALIYGGSLIFAMPFFYKTLGTMTGQQLTFTASQMFMMLALIVTLVFLYISIIAVCSTLAHNMKEASTYIMPAYIVIMVVAMMSMFKGENVTNVQYLIPLYGSTMALKNVFTLDITVTGFLLAMLSNLVCGGVLAALVARMFRSERIMLG